MSHASPTIRRLTPDLRGDFLRFFEGAAFADNPKWRSCYCQFLYVDHAKVTWSARTAEENRASACERIACGRMQGLLAYRDGAPSASAIGLHYLSQRSASFSQYPSHF